MSTNSRRSDIAELLFRVLFSTIFIALGGEHLFHDTLLRMLMPDWVPEPRAASMGAGCILLIGGGLVLIGYKLRMAATILGGFLVAVTLLVHLPALFSLPASIHPDDAWLWAVLQHSNLAKNLCLLGVCIHLRQHTPGRYSIDHWLARRHVDAMTNQT